MKINWKPVKEVVELAGGAVTYVVLLAAYRKFMDHMNNIPSSVIVGYGDAVNAIMKSGMFSHDKASAVSALKRNGNTEFYKAIIHIADDDSMFSHDKLKMIENLSLS